MTQPTPQALHGQIEGARINANLGIEVLQNGEWHQVRQGSDMRAAIEAKRELLHERFWAEKWRHQREFYIGLWFRANHDKKMMANMTDVEKIRYMFRMGS